MLEFQQQQARLTAHLRDPDHAPAPAGIEERRLKIYRELFYNNVEGFLANAFPVLRQLSDDGYWHALVRDFFACHRSSNPLFNGLAEEFLRFLESERGEHEADAPFLKELAHYEWVELALSVAEDAPVDPAIDPEGDLLEGVPVISSLAWTLAYDFPVHRISPAHQPQVPGTQPTLLTVWRNPECDIKFLEINLFTARLLELLGEARGCSGRELLMSMAEEMAHPEASQLLHEGAGLLDGLRMRGIILGARFR